MRVLQPRATSLPGEALAGLRIVEMDGECIDILSKDVLKTPLTSPVATVCRLLDRMYLSGATHDEVYEETAGQWIYRLARPSRTAVRITRKRADGSPGHAATVYPLRVDCWHLY